MSVSRRDFFDSSHKHRQNFYNIPIFEDRLSPILIEMQVISTIKGTTIYSILGNQPGMSLVPLSNK